MIVIYSEKDPAGMNIAQRLHGLGLELLKVNEDITRCDKEIEGIGADKIIFASRHRSEKGQASFTVHPIGNWGPAEKGGKERTICQSMPIEMRNALRYIDKHPDVKKFKDAGWKVCMEVTHHGPLCSVPCFFIEIGSSETEWRNEEAGRIIADAIIKLQEIESNREMEKKIKICFGAGGGHYSPKFTPLILNSNFAFSHILPDYHAENVDFETFRQGIEASDKNVECVLMDWKGLKKAGRDRIVEFSKQAGMKTERA